LRKFVRNSSILKHLRVAKPPGKRPEGGTALPSNLRAAALVITTCLLTISPLWAAEGWQIVQQKDSDGLEVRAPKAGRHTLEIDDAFGFRTPVVTTTFRGSRWQSHALALGLIPGLDYHARLDGGGEVRDFRIQLNTFTEPEVSCANLRRTWEQSGRRLVGDSHSRVGWDAAKRDWIVLPHDPLIGGGLYYVEHYIRPTLTAARACHDLQTLDEIAKYYLVMLQLTEPLGDLLNTPRILPVIQERMNYADRSARVFPADIGGQPADGELYTVQWLHPAAEFLRLITLLPPARRTPAMLDFASRYPKFVVVEQLERYLVQQRLHAPGIGLARGRIEMWKRAMSGMPGETPWANNIFDIDLWLVASAAEVLGANANDPALAPLDAGQAAMLHSAIDTGIRFLEKGRNEYPDTKNFRGEQVGSITFGNGDYVAHPDFDYSGVFTEKFPTPEEKRTLPNAGWDVAHAYRLPVFMRALYENRKATGCGWPPYHELQLFTNQYMYRVFNGDFSRPLFHTHLDGSDGWHRVGYHGGDWGYPPSRYCDQHNSHRPCMSPASFMGWGDLAFANPDLAQLEQALVKLGVDPAPQTEQFRDRYYFDYTPFALLGPPGKQIYAMTLYFLIGDNAEMIAPRLSPKSQ
jgi:hypothetical protein